MNGTFYSKIQTGLSSERLEAYAVRTADSADDPTATLARYLLNMALCESLYSPLQLCEIALRNAIHHHLCSLMSREDWFDHSGFLLTPWAATEIAKAKTQTTKSKKSVTPGRVVAELNFGFWTSLFEDHYEKQTPFLPSAFKAVFPHMPKSLHKRKERKADLEKIRILRNRVFHHERIVHWKDLDAQHQLILAVISWISPELRQMADALDRFSSLRKSGLTPWLDKLRCHWPDSSAPPVTSTESIATVESIFDASNGAHTPFGHRWGGDVFALSSGHIEVMRSGQTLALDVMNEYVVFLKAEPEEGKEDV
jgi:hypothetical protein